MRVTIVGEVFLERGEVVDGAVEDGGEVGIAGFFADLGFEREEEGDLIGGFGGETAIELAV